MKKRIISMLLTLAMVGGLAACGEGKPAAQESTPTTAESTVSSETAESSSEAEVKEPVTITLMPSNANLTSGVVGGWAGEYLAEHGIILEVWAYSEDKVNAIMASGDYPDVMYFPNKTDFNVLAEEGLLLDLNEYMDKLPEVTQDDELKVAVSYVDKYVIDESDKLAVLPTIVGAANAKMNTGGRALSINWELYEQIGSPKVNSWEDMIDVFKKMQETWPVSDTGVKTYAMHLYGGADKDYFKGADNILLLSGYTCDWLKWFLVGNTQTGEYEYMLEDDGIYKYAIRYYNTLYREGLLDPDSITYDRKTVISIVDTEGSTLAGWPNVPAYEKKGFMPLYFDGMRVVNNKQIKTYGGNNFIGISSKCENVDAALELLNLLADPDCARVLKCGPEGELWEYNAAGEAVVTEKGKAYFVNGENVTIGNEMFAPINTQTISNVGKMASDGKQIQISGWPEITSATNATETVSKWMEHYNTSDFKELLGEDYVTVSFDQELTSFVEQPSEEDELLFAAAKDIIVDASWKMVYAESDAEFEKIWDDAVAECEKLGVKKLTESRIEALAKAVEVRDELKK